MKNYNNKHRVAVIGLKRLPAFGGAASVGEKIIQNLQTEYLFYVYLTSSHTNNVSILGEAYKKIIFRSIPFRKLNTLYYYLISALHATFISKYDLIHLHHRDAAFIIPILKLRSKVILTIHGFGTNNLSTKWEKFKFYYDLQERFFIRFADIITSVSKSEVKQIEKYASKPVLYIPNGVDLIEFEKTSGTSKHLLFVASRIISFKRLDVLLKALIKLNSNEQLLIIGDLDQSEDYKNLIYQLTNGLNVKFLGLIKDKVELYKTMLSSRMIILPSVREAMSMTLLESAALKVPVICSLIDGNTNLFDENEVTFFNVDDVGDLSNKIAFAIANHEIIVSKAEKAYQKVVNNYNWSDISIEYNKLYKSILKN